MLTRLEKSFAGVLLLLVFMAAMVVFKNFHLTTDLGAVLPSGESKIDSLMVDLLDKGSTSNLVFIGIRGAAPGTLAQVNNTLAETLRASDYFAAVHNAPQGLSDTQQQVIRQYRYLLSDQPASRTMTETGLRQALALRMQGLTSPLASLEKAFIRFDPTGEILHLMGQLANQDKDRSTAPRLVDGVWVSQSGQRSLMVLEINATAFDIDRLAEAIAIANNEMIRLAEDYGVCFDVTGPGAFAVEIRNMIRGDIKTLSIFATLGVGLFLLIALRSILLVLLVFMPLACGIICAIAVVLLVFGNINGITLAFGLTLIGVAIDYPIHFFTHLGGGKNPSRSSLNLIWPTLRLGVLSTVIAYGSLLFSDLYGLRQLGLFTITGLLMAAMVTRWILPLVMPDTLPEKTGWTRLHGFLELLALPAYRVRWIVLAATIAALVYLVLVDAQIADYDTRSLSPISTAQTELDREVRNELGHWSGGSLLLVTGESDQQVLTRLEQLKPLLDGMVRRQVVSDYTSIAAFLPSVQLQRQRQSELPGRVRLQNNLDAVVGEFPFKPGLFENFVNDVESSKSIQPITVDRMAELGLQDQITALLQEKQGIWYAPVLLYHVSSPGLVKAELQKAWPDNTWAVYVNLLAQSNRIMESGMDNMIRLITIGGFCIYLLLAVVFRDMIRPLKILLPTLMAVGLTVFILVNSGILLTALHVVSLLLVVGLGLDYSLFFHRLTDHTDEWPSTFRALWLCCFSTVLVFSMLVISNSPPLQAVGRTVSIGALFCLVLGAVFASRSLRHPD